MTLPAAADLASILSGSRAALARAASLVEREAPGAAELSAALASHCGRAHVIGITGAPGAGKSTLIAALLGEYTRRGRRVAVVAVDPSSPISGGAILGDRVRMGEHGFGAGVFIRSLSARGHLGGLSRATGRVVDVFDAAGFDLVIVETVGAGQSDVAISQVADTRVVVCPPGLGDEVQAIKAGILEIADIFVVNKADLALAERTVLDLQTASHLSRRPGWQVAVLRTVATRSEGVSELADLIDEHARSAGRGSRLKSIPTRAPPPIAARVAHGAIARPRLFVIGAVRIAQALAPMAVLTGFDVVVIDPRRALAATRDLPGITASTEQPEVELARRGLDARCAVLTLTRDETLAGAALVTALRSAAFYVGAIGGSHCQALRATRLTAAGLGDVLSRLQAAVGPGSGGHAPSEVAVFILAQLIQARQRAFKPVPAPAADLDLAVRR